MVAKKKSSLPKSLAASVNRREEAVARKLVDAFTRIRKGHAINPSVASRFKKTHEISYKMLSEEAGADQPDEKGRYGVDRGWVNNEKHFVIKKMVDDYNAVQKEEKDRGAFKQDLVSQLKLRNRELRELIHVAYQERDAALQQANLLQVTVEVLQKKIAELNNQG